MKKTIAKFFAMSGVLSGPFIVWTGFDNCEAVDIALGVVIIGIGLGAIWFHVHDKAPA